METQRSEAQAREGYLKLQISKIKGHTTWL